MDKSEALKVLKEHGQEHVMKGFDNLSLDLQEQLLRQIEEIDWETIALVGQDSEGSEGDIEPLGAVDVSQIEARKEEFTKAGIDAIKEGKIGAVLLAGGMGTRLGLDKPKGELNVGINRDLCIFNCLINNLLDVTNEAGAFVPLYVMTSEKNNDETIRFFEEKNYFGYPKEYVKFFIQEMAAAVDFDGKLLLEGPGRLATSPNGNGGWFTSLAKAGLLDDIKSRGVEWLNIFAVDNVLQRIADPSFIGATLLSGADSGSKVVHKVDAYEKMGALCKKGGKPYIVEYYELSKEMAEATDESGDYLYAYGVILNYIFKVSRLEEIMNNRMPVHVVEKKIPYIDDKGELIKPSEPNGYKFETLVVDMVAMMNDSVPYEVIREKEFAPIKNLHGVDSLDSARELLEKNNVEL